jgi:enoyl-CoA hydratase/carnithine racemase
MMPMSEPQVRSERRGSMAVLTLNRPDARNPLDRELSQALLDELRRAGADSAVRSVGITGAGEAFCAGGDLRQMAEFAHLPVEDSYAWPQAIVDLHKEMLQFPKPVVAAVNGAAYAGGLGLAGMCDVVVAASTARFAMPEAKLGLFPMIIVGHLARSIPRKILLEMMMTGDPISAQTGHQVGFVNRICKAEELPAVLAEYAAKFEKVSPRAIALGRKTFTLLADLPAAQAIDAAQFLNLPFFLGRDLADGVDAFLQRGKPPWIETADSGADGSDDAE